MESLSQAKVGSTLQVFFNLNELSKAVANQTASYLAEIEKSARVSTRDDVPAVYMSCSVLTSANLQQGQARIGVH